MVLLEARELARELNSSKISAAQVERAKELLRRLKLPPEPIACCTPMGGDTVGEYSLARKNQKAERKKAMRALRHGLAQHGEGTPNLASVYHNARRAIDGKLSNSGILSLDDVRAIVDKAQQLLVSHGDSLRQEQAGQLLEHLYERHPELRRA